MTKNKIVTLGVLGVFTLSSVSLALFMKKGESPLENAATSDRVITINFVQSEPNCVVSGTQSTPVTGNFTVKTSLGNDVEFSYKGAWDEGGFKPGTDGYICNVSEIGTTKSTNMFSSGSGSYKIELGWEKEASVISYAMDYTGYHSSTGYEKELTDDECNYVKFDYFSDDAYIQKIMITYDENCPIAETKIFSDGEFTYRLLNDGNLGIVSYDQSESNVSIPVNIVHNEKGYAVHEILESAFKGKSCLISVTIPDSITYIGDSAFENCINLITTNIPTGLTYLGQRAFANNYALSINVVIPGTCRVVSTAAFISSGITSVVFQEGVESINSASFRFTKITSISIPSTVNSISQAFDRNSELASITVSPSNTHFWAQNAELYELDKFGDLYRLVVIGGAQTGTYVMPSTVQEMDSYGAREGSLTGVVINDSLKRIPADAFASNKLTSVTIGSSVTEISNYAFSGNNNLTSVTIPGNVKKVFGCAFSSCSALATVTVEEGVEELESATFRFSENITNAYIPKSMNYLGRQLSFSYGPAVFYSNSITIHCANTMSEASTKEGITWETGWQGENATVVYAS